MKKCSKCEEVKEVRFFDKNKSSPDGLRSTCKTCAREYGKKYYKDNKKQISNQRREFLNKEGVKDRRRKKSKEWYTKNSKKVKQRTSEYAKKNRDRYSKYVRDWYKNNKSNTNYVLSCRLRSRLSNALKGRFRYVSAVEDIGCSIECLKLYLECKFQPGMSWDNYGEWHVDHIIPISSFDLSIKEEQLKACHYTNLQPLWAKDNISKSNKIGEEYGNERLDEEID